MRVILRKEVPELGKAGEVKSVSDGFARNFLLPRGMAELATEANMRAMNRQLAARAAREEREKHDYQALAQKLESITLRFALKAGGRGQSFGSVSKADIAERLTREGVRIDRRWIELEQGIKASGEHTVKIKLPHRVEAGVTVVIEPEPEGSRQS